MSANDPITPSDAIDTNVVTILDNAKVITNIVYVDNSLEVSQGQQSSPPPSINFSGGGIANGWSISLQANRQKTTQVANDFNNLFDGNDNEYSPVASSTSPSQLNFFFGIDVYAGQGVTRVYLAQGSFGLTNNWWIGSNDLRGTTLNLFTGSDFVALNITGEEDSFVLSSSSEASSVSDQENLVAEEKR